MKSEAVVSVIVPTYNRPERLRRALQSIQRQTYDNIEVVVVDDHSDESPEHVIDSLSSDLSVKFVRHSENKGANAARSTGIIKSCGQYVAFLDDDDTWESEKIKAQVQELENSDAGVSYTGIRQIDGENNIIHESNPIISGDITKKLLERNPVGTFSTVLVDREVIYQAGLPDERFPIWQDKEWYIRLSKNTKFKPVPEILVNHHVESGDRISDGFTDLEKKALPLFLKKFQDDIKRRGEYGGRPIYSSVYSDVSRYGLSTGNPDKAKEYATKALVKYPANIKAIICFVLAMHDGYLYEKYRKINKIFSLQT
ncbi:glycosyltransferase family 2 protein [Halogeometricum borinquense]|uniref:Glycosyltransferase family 2 protein n=1 Tax=Halogeometricum borinquense TaxID=60847 RepID=A0A482T3H3_9EURY|nr:glycosyltransferase family 2 protein [Halogeometricum borinquense]RYJ08642.1 glycosyltransferase family 2 protein [Halogeometricum borinquense]